MENIENLEMIDETSIGRNSTVAAESQNGTYYEIINESTLDTEAYNRQNMETSPNLEDKGECGNKGLFAPFSHQMRPDPELARLELEQSSLNQEAFSKVINERYKLMQMIVKRRKEKEEEILKNRIKFTQTFDNVEPVEIMETTQLSPKIDVEDIEKTTQLLHRMHLPPGTHTRDQSEEFSDHSLDKIHLHNGLNRFIYDEKEAIETPFDVLSEEGFESYYEV